MEISGHSAIPGGHKAPPYEALCAELLEQGYLRQADLERALHLQQLDNDDLLTLLIKLGLVAEQDMAATLSRLCQLPLISASGYPELRTIDADISVRFMKSRQVLPLRQENNHLVVAMVNPYDSYVIKSLSLACASPIVVEVGLAHDINTAIERLYGDGRSTMKQIADGFTGNSGNAVVDEEDADQLRDLASEAPVVRLVNLIFQRAVESGASDIHLEPFEGQLKVRYRIDGVLIEAESPPAPSTAAVISRIKILAKLNIAERRLPQDGRLMLPLQGKTLDLRVSTVPTLHGECLVIRLLDRDSLNLDFKGLGFGENALRDFMAGLNQPNGIMLVTGPTGSGKTTTLYSALTTINRPEIKIITVEDPVEYQLEGINQIQIKPTIGLDFANTLRSIVRQDPDVIMIGEMRDLETARIAVQSALTGHRVLSTLHTNDAAGGITRLLDMGIQGYLLTATVNGILAQRLVRRLCMSCRQRYEVTPETAVKIGLCATDISHLFKATGCDECFHTGYQGRIALVEYLTITDAICSLIMQQASLGQIRKQAVEDGMDTLYTDGIQKCIQGFTTVEEVFRVTQTDT